MPRAGALALGAVAAAWLDPTIGVAGSALLAAAVLILIAVARSGGRAGLARVALVACIGFGAVGIRLLPTAMAGPPPGATALPDDRGPWTFIVEVVGSARDGHQTATLALVPEAVSSAVGRNDTPARVALRVAATLPAYPAVIPGDVVLVEGSIQAPPDSPYGEYLRRIGADGTLQARSMTVAAAPDSPSRTLEHLRRSAGIALASVLPEPEAGLAAGILIGLRDLVDRDLAAAFTTAGVSHVVAISGWNIAIVAAAIAAMVGRLGRRRRSVVTIVAIVLYVVFAGASASVVRAGLMAGVVLLARESGRAGQATAALGWAVTILLVVDPGLVRDPGLQLSALATAGLIAWATPLTAALDRFGRGHLPRWLTENLGVSFAAQAATLPLILVSFGRLSLVAPAVNLVVVPLVAPAMAAGLVAMLAGALVMVGTPWVVGAVLAAPAWVLLRILVSIVDAAAALPFASVTLAPPADALTAVAAGILIVALHRRLARSASRSEHVTSSPAPSAPAAPSAPPPAATRTAIRPSGMLATGRWSRVAGLALAVAILVAGGIVAARPAGVARITVLDVGQGDAILIEGSNGGRLLIDGGPDPDRLLVALDGRLPPWDRRLDAVILSHPHEDHVAGLARLLDRYRVKRVFEPGTRGPGPGYAAWIERLGHPGAPERGSLAAGDHLSVDEIAMTVLWPIAGQVPLEPPDGGTGINNVSIVLLGTVGSSRFLLAGDVEQDIDPHLLATGLPRLDFLKVAHHGSRTATTQAFVDAVRPRVAVASAGTGNPYGHPTKQTIDRLQAAGARVYRTDKDGSVSVTFGREGMTVRAEGGRAADGPPTSAPSAAPGIAAAHVGAAEVGGADRDATAIRFRCAIPVTALVPEREPVRRTAAAPTLVWGSAGPQVDGRASAVGYHRTDDGTPARGGRVPPALPGSPTLVRATRARRGRGGRVPGRPDRGRRHRGGSTTRGVGRAPPRRGQGAPRGRPGSGAPTWGWLGGLADPARAP
jgi:competence protein ComEC